MRKVICIDGNVEWKYWYDSETDLYVGTCDILNLNAADTKRQGLVTTAIEAMSCLFENLYEENELLNFAENYDFDVEVIGFANDYIFDLPIPTFKEVPTYEELMKNRSK